MNDLKIDKKSLIGGGYISKNVCKDIINFFKKNEDLQTKGLVGQRLYNKNVKQSNEILLDVNSFVNLFPDYCNELQMVLENYKKKYYFSNDVHSYSIKQDIKIQHYKKNEGFKVWHFENDGTKKYVTRHLVFMTYLNTVKNGGTDFLYQDLTTKAEEGLTLIWPAQWTHTHKGQISECSEKFIVTGWYSFNE